MKPFVVFRVGNHTSSNGLAANFSELDLEKSARDYDPSLHEAPLVIGHPKDNSPAQGWAEYLKYSEGDLIVFPRQINPVFENSVKSGRYKKRSASFYLPDSPNNPKPGTLYLRHVGFVAIPAVKGMPDPEFKEAEEGTITFVEMPNEQNENPNDLDFAEQKRQLEEREKQIEFKERRMDAFNWLDPLVVKGKLSDKEAKGFADFFAHFGSGETFEVQFGEGEQKQDSLKFLEKFLSTLPTRINYGEIATGNDEPQELTPEQVAAKAEQYKRKMAEQGQIISYTEACNAVKKGLIEV